MPSGTQQNEIVQLQQSIAAEVNRDAPAIAQGIFGDNKNHPDMAQVSNQQLDDLYRQKFQAQDRVWLQAEARRDPNQFMDVAKRIGVQPPSTAPGMPSSAQQGGQVDQNAMAKMLSTAMQGQAPPAPAAPMGLPAAAPALPPPPALPVAPMAPAGGLPVAPVAGPGVGGPVALPLPPSGPAAPPPVILGPNGQPLPPSGVPS